MVLALSPGTLMVPVETTTLAGVAVVAARQMPREEKESAIARTTTRQLKPAGEAHGATADRAGAERAWRKSASKNRRDSGRFGGVAGFFLVAGFIFQAEIALGQQEPPSILASGGATGSISIPIASNPLSFVPDDVTITVSAPPGLDLQTRPSSQLGPSSVAPGPTVQFVLNYQVGPSAVDGTYTVMRISDHDRHRLGANPASVSEHDPPASRSNVRHRVGLRTATA